MGRHCYIMRDLYKQEFVSSNQQKCARYDAYIDFIEMKVAHNQKYWHQSIEKAKKIIIHQKIETANEHLIKLDNHSLFSLFVILSDCYSKINELAKADSIFEQVIFCHIQMSQYELQYIWIFDIFLNHLLNKKEWTKGYNFCIGLIANNPLHQFSQRMTKMMQRFNVMHHFQSTHDCELEDPFHFILDAEHFGNQCRFVNHSNNAQNVNCAFILRHNFGNCSFPSISEVWCRAIKKIEKGNELFVDYGDSYWNNLDIAMPLNKESNGMKALYFR